MARTPPPGLYYLLIYIARDELFVHLYEDVDFFPFLFSAGTRGALDQQGVKRYTSALPNSKLNNNFSSPKLYPSLASGDLIAYLHIYWLLPWMYSYPINNVTGVQRKLDMANQVGCSLNILLFLPHLLLPNPTHALSLYSSNLKLVPFLNRSVSYGNDFFLFLLQDGNKNEKPMRTTQPKYRQPGKDSPSKLFGL